MSARKHTLAALDALLAYLVEMQEVVQRAQTGDAEAIDHIREEYTGPYTVCRGLAENVSHGEQWDDDDEQTAAAEREEAERACQGERA